MHEDDDVDNYNEDDNAVEDCDDDNDNKDDDDTATDDVIRMTRLR